MSINLEDYAGKKEFPVIDGGDYEVVLTATITTNKAGTGDYLNLGFKIRDDVEQKFNDGHAYVFEKLFRDKQNPEWFDLTKSGSILVTQKGKAGYKTKFDEVEEFVQYINGINLVITVEKVYDEYFQKEVNQVKYLSYKPSKLGNYAPPVKDNGGEVKEGGNIEKLNIPDSDIPF